MRGIIKFILTSILIGNVYRVSAYAQSEVDGPDSEAIKVGAILHLTGDLAMSSKAFQEGIRVGLDEINQHGIRGHKLQLVFEDGRNDTKASNTAAQKLLNFDKIAACLLESYLDVMSDGSLFERYGVPAITLWDSSPDIDAAGDYIFAIGPWTPSAGDEVAQFATEKLHKKRAVVFYNSDYWSENAAKFFKDKFKALGGEIVESILLNPNDVDFRSAITKVKGLGADMIYTPLVFNLVPFYRQLKQLGYQGDVLTSDIISDEHISQAPEAFENIYQTGMRNPNSSTFEHLKMLYFEKYKKELTLPWFVAVGYDSIRLLAQSMERVGFNPKLIKDELYKVKNFPGASTTLTISPQGSSPQLEKMFRIHKGKFVPLYEQ